VLRDIADTMPPLRGIMHAAGVLDDAMLADQNADRFRRVMAPKVSGTWNLHEQTATLGLDFFVMFSSGAALMGSPGQGNYAAANAFMDALAHVRHALGLPALSINWGSWADVGMAAGVSAEHQRRWESMGLQLIAPEQGMQMLHDVLYGVSAPQVAAFPLVRSRLPATLGPFFSELVASQETQSAEAVQGADVLRLVQDASPEERGGHVTDFITDQVVRVLALGAASRVDRGRSLVEMGMDSLMAMELRNRIQTSLKVAVSVSSLLEGSSIEQIGGIILRSLDVKTPVAVPAESSAAGEWEEGTL
jgi:hypothetical protein